MLLLLLDLLPAKCFGNVQSSLLFFGTRFDKPLPVLGKWRIPPSLMWAYQKMQQIYERSAFRVNEDGAGGKKNQEKTPTTALKTPKKEDLRLLRPRK